MTTSRTSQAAECLSQEIEERRQRQVDLQREIDSLICARDILLQRHDDADTIDRSPRVPSTSSVRITTKVMKAATMLADHVRRIPGQTISTKDASTFLLDRGLTTEKSVRFHVWQILNAGGMFERVSRGAYRLIDVKPSESLSLIPSPPSNNGEASTNDRAE